MKIAIVDTGGANLASVKNAFLRLGADSELTSSWTEIERADRVILPGVGAAPDCMARLDANQVTQRLSTLTKPVLGICLGMQILYEWSEEGGTKGLGILPGKVRKIEAAPGKPVPHMGWNQVRVLRDTPLFQGIPDGENFYFVHSFKAEDSKSDLAFTEYGGERIPAAAAKGRFLGVQFHPERSGSMGARLLRNFLEL